jgi:two-component system NtrC family sensor kinase
MSRRSTAAERTHTLPHLVAKPSLCRAFAEGSPMPMAELEGSTHTVCYVNPAFCQLSNKSREELIGRDFCDIGPAGNECLFFLSRVYRTGKSHTHIGQQHSAMHLFYWSYSVWPVLSLDDRTLGVILQITETTRFHQDSIAMNQALLIGSVQQHELTEAAELLTVQLQQEIIARKKAEEALIGSEKLASVGRMAAVLAHEINNPIAAVMDIVYLMKATEGLPEPVPEYLEMADGELKRIAHITRQTLGFCSEMSSPTTFHVCELLDSVVDLLKAKIKSRGAIVEQQCDGDLQITATHGELRQVFSNLLLNSLHALNKNGRVTLRGSFSLNPVNGKRRIRVTVADNGAGISASALPQIFEAFFTTKGAVGNGLGLWVSRRIVDKHGGFLRVRSCTSGPHQGTSFSVVLPSDTFSLEEGVIELRQTHDGPDCSETRSCP